MADAIVAVSRETKGDIERLFDVDPARVHVIHNGIDLDQYRKVDSTAALKRYGIDPNKPYLLFVGRITRQKGFQHLLRAIEFMDARFPNRSLRRCARYAADGRRNENRSG